MENIFKAIGVFLAVLIIFSVFALILALPLMLLWDWLMPKIFGLPEITFWQALGLNFLSGILFKNASDSVKKSE